MPESEQQFLSRLRETFRVEAEEHLAAISDGLLELEKKPAADRAAGLVETIYREAHSLKGAARAVNYTDIETICQTLESVLAALKRGEVVQSEALFDALHRTTDIVGKLISVPGGKPVVDIMRLARELEAFDAGGENADPASPSSLGSPRTSPDSGAQRSTGSSGQTDESQPSGPPASGTTLEHSGGPPASGADGVGGAQASLASDPSAHPSVDSGLTPLPATETVRISVAKLDRLLFEVEGMLGAKLAGSQRAIDVADLLSQFALWRKRWAKIAPELRALRKYFEGQEFAASLVKAPALLEFLEHGDTVYAPFEEKLRALEQACESDRRSTGSMVDSLMENMKQALMVPLSTFLQVVPKLVRDLARDQGKAVDLVLQGGDVEIDRRVLEQVKDPLIHLVRNAIDHGIESPTQRSAAGKPERGTLTIAVSQSQGKVEILVSDDGGGINLAKVREAAVRAGISVDGLAASDEQAALGLIFQSGVSTSTDITTISGRGLGMAIVRENVEKLGGRILITTHPGTGSQFRLLLPLTLATFRGILVRARGRDFVLPTAHVDRVLRVRKEEMRTVEGRDTILVDGRALAYVVLGDLLQLPLSAEASQAAKFVPAVVVAFGDKRVAFGVDAVVNEEEVLVKTLGKRLRRVRNVSAATVLASGRVVPILDAADLIETSASARDFIPQVAPIPVAQKSVLIAEDSITSRMLLKNIVESAGYRARTAVDGAAALAALRSEPFDLLISDVEMPRLNGFDLTASVRGDERLAQLPVVLVTSRESREDREHGIDVGANAYVVKSSFDQSNLLEIIRKII